MLTDTWAFPALTELTAGTPGLVEKEVEVIVEYWAGLPYSVTT
jgi:hypothetical protein